MTTLIATVAIRIRGIQIIMWLTIVTLRITVTVGVTIIER